MHDPREAARRVGPDRQHEAVVADGDEVVLQHGAAGLGAQDLLERLGQPLGELADVAPHAAQLGRGAVLDETGRAEVPLDRADDPLQFGKSRPLPGQRRQLVGIERAQESRDLARHDQQAHGLEDLAAGQGPAGDRQLVEHPRRVLHRHQRQAPTLGQHAPHPRRAVLRAQRVAGLVHRGQGERLVAPHRGPRPRRDHLQHASQLEPELDLRGGDHAPLAARIERPRRSR